METRAEIIRNREAFAVRRWDIRQLLMRMHQYTVMAKHDTLDNSEIAEAVRLAGELRDVVMERSPAPVVEVLPAPEPPADPLAESLMYFHLKPDIFELGRDGTNARFHVWTRMHEHHGMGFAEIGRRTGYEHTSVMYGVRAVRANPSLTIYTPAVIREWASAVLLAHGLDLDAISCRDEHATRAKAALWHELVEVRRIPMAAVGRALGQRHTSILYSLRARKRRESVGATA
jgi:hypothetical protein